MTFSSKAMIAAALALFVAGCGADGAPERPEQPGLHLSGEARMGLSYRN